MQGIACTKAKRHRRAGPPLETKFATSIDYHWFGKQGKRYSQNGRSGQATRD